MAAYTDRGRRVGAVDDDRLKIVAAEWRHVAPRLLRYVRNRIGTGLLPKGHDAEDVVQMAFVRLLSGSRAWDPSKANLETHMKRSILPSMVGSKGLPYVKDAGGVEFTDEEDGDHLNGDGVRALDLARDQIPEMDRAAAFEMLEQEIAGDRELEDILTAIRMKCRTPDEIAEATGIDVKRVYCLRRKLAASADKVSVKFQSPR